MPDIQEHYAAILADLEAERDGLNKAIELIRRKMGIEPTVAAEAVSRERATASPAPAGNGGPNVRPDEFFQLSASQAAQKYLAKIKRPATAKEIMEALVAGGFASKSDSLYSTVFTALTRNKGTIFSNLGRSKGWGLKAWYGQKPPTEG